MLQQGGNFIRGQAQYADVNGDGRADLIFQGNDNSFKLSLSNGSGFDTPVSVLQEGGSFVRGQAQYADMNGDGKADLIFQGNDNTFNVALSTGTGFASPFVAMAHGGGTTFVEGQARYADVNADGRADLIFQDNDNTFWVSVSDGASFAGMTKTFAALDHGGSFVLGQAGFADFNGDGRSDLMFQSTDNRFWLSSGYA
ncbi:VCBS repeat-containing protein [Azospirillum sp. B506]|uniref:FG-GAP repeat domain-containing protein n=1 Tax=Azospirillum sp. B506 TaxID=137721 RepID=UPI00131F263B|nr:VCBS repeat-containing protein [Azospirillum sp. B506]